ncbi:MAG: peptidylprolyl isomerase [Actinomycetia bacterium]|nr:peptidylprolyl isomerase [Actinomycetes bacterium]
MAGSKRERDVARAKFERQQARRAEQATRRQQRTRLTAAIVLTVLLVGGLAGLAIALQDTGEESSTAADPNQVVCLYPRSGEAVKPVDGVPPLTTSLLPATSAATLQFAGGPVTVELLNAAAPCTTNSFAFLADQGWFDGSDCHRLTEGTLNVLQCGDPSGTGSGGPGYTFDDENLDGATYPAGTVAMANSGPNTNGSQFFLVYADSQLPPSYTPFGRVTAGLDVLTGIAAAGIEGGTDDGAPAEPVTIESATVAAG